MTCEVPRTYIPVPDPTGSSIIIPQNITDPLTLRNTLQNIIDQSGATGPPPGPVQNFTSATKNGGTLLTWDFLRTGAYYIIYRGTTNQLSNAYTVGIVPEGITLRGQFMDPCGQDTAATLIYYWIQPYSRTGVPGPYAMTSMACVDCGIALVTSFSDTFDRANTSFGAGNNWMQGGSINTSTSPGVLHGGNISANAFVWTRSGANINDASPLAWVPAPIVTPYAASGINQYSQLTFSSSDSAQGSKLLYCGPACCLTFEGSQLKGIFMYTAVNAGGFRYFGVGQWLNNVWTLLFEVGAATAFHLYVAGDVLRLECTINATTISVNAKINGVSQGTGTASAVGAEHVATVGVPGIGHRLFITSGLQTANTIFSDFSCGPL